MAITITVTITVKDFGSTPNREICRGPPRISRPPWDVWSRPANAPAKGPFETEIHRNTP